MTIINTILDTMNAIIPDIACYIFIGIAGALLLVSAVMTITEKVKERAEEREYIYNRNKKEALAEMKKIYELNKR